MIKLFRLIRRNLMETGTTGKYFIYALGEIVLVVLGILIALQINNWNQANQDVETQYKYLNNIKNDLNEQLIYIEIQKTYEKNFMDAAIPELTYFNSHNNFRFDSSFFANINALAARKTFITTDPAFTDLISSGNIKLIKNDTLKKNIISYYQDLELAEKIIQNNNIFIVDQQYGNAVKDIGYYFFNSESYYLKDVKELDTNVEKAATQLSHFNSLLATTSENLLRSSENQLLLMNSLNQRANVAIAHYQRALILEEKSRKLIKDIEEELNA